MNKAKILIVDDDQNLREAIADTLKLAGYSCIEAVNGLDALAKLAVTEIDMVISDVQMEGMDGHALLNNINNMYPRFPVLLITAYANINGAIRAMREGAVDYLAKPFAPEVLLNQVGRYVPSYQVETKEPVYGDPKTGQLFALAVKVARSDASVMITGPSGSGKEVLSRYIHDHSPRASKPFVAINCAAIPESMLEATLFGYEKGAFTGAVQACPGKFEQAQDGTILLDEITEMDLNLQAKLLRVLQEKEVERLGGRKTIPLNVRVLATSNRNLKEAVAKGLFREDLYYRLNVFPLAWFPLKDRRGDIIPLAEHLLALHAKEQGRKIPVLSDDAKQTLLNYDFPGNVRELDNLVQRALILSDEEVVSENLLLEGDFTMHIQADPFNVCRNGQENSLPNENSGGEYRDNEGVADGQICSELKEQENQLIINTLKEYNGSRKCAAEKLGISPRTLRYKIAKMRELGLDIPEMNRFDKPLPNFA